MLPLKLVLRKKTVIFVITEVFRKRQTENIILDNRIKLNMKQYLDLLQRVLRKKIVQVPVPSAYSVIKADSA
jgi:thymidylate synthase